MLQKKKHCWALILINKTIKAQCRELHHICCKPEFKKGKPGFCLLHQTIKLINATKNKHFQRKKMRLCSNTNCSATSKNQAKILTQQTRKRPYLSCQVRAICGYFASERDSPSNATISTRNQCMITRDILCCTANTVPK